MGRPGNGRALGADQGPATEPLPYRVAAGRETAKLENDGNLREAEFGNNRKATQGLINPAVS